MDELTPAEQLPTLYRTILDGVARLERAGDRAEAARIREAAIAAYSTAWDAAHRRRLEQLVRRVDRALAAHAPALSATGVLSRTPTA